MSVFRQIHIHDEHDIVLCRRACREVARDNKFNLVDQTRITTAASELARNIFEYAEEGDVFIEIVEDFEENIGLKLTFIDSGPGIIDVEEALQEGWTSNQGMGLGLPGSKKLMDEFEVSSNPGKGTKITAIKWLK